MLLSVSPFAKASPMEAIVLQKSSSQHEVGIHAEQAQLQQASERSRVEVSQDEHLPLSFRRSEGPKGAPLLNISW